MRTASLLTITGTSLTALVATGLVAGQGTAAAGVGKTLTVTEKAVTIGQQDVGDKGPSIGDTFTFVSDLLDAKGGKIGIGVGNGILVPAKSGSKMRYNFVGTYRLPGGDVAISGIYDFAKTSSTTAIVGGTGRYRGASGVLVITAKSEDTYINTFRFDA